MKFGRFFPNSLSFRVILPIYLVIPLVGFLGAFGYFALRSIEKQVVRQMQKDLELVARAVELPVSYALEKNRMGSVQQALESVFSIGRVYGAYVYDAEGVEIARLGRRDEETEDRGMRELTERGKRRGEYRQIGERHVYSYFVPLTDMGGKINGLLHLTRKASEFQDHVQSIRTKGALSLTMLLILLSAAVLYGHHRALGEHLNRLLAVMSGIGRGDRRLRFDARGPREVVLLGRAFNNMLDGIEGTQHALEEQRAKRDVLERQLQEAQKLAALGRLAAGTAHELGTPLSVISGKAQRALRIPTLSPQLQKAMLAIRGEVHRMEHIIRQLLDFTRRNPLRCSAVRPAQLAQAALAAVEAEAEAGNTRLLKDGTNNAGLIAVDTVRVQQALVNLLRNAIQSSPGGAVRCVWEPVPGGVCFGVEDDGPGVPQEIRPKIFEPFFTTKSVGRGTGLGLSIVHTVAEEHGGYVEVGESTLGGSLFKLFVREQPETPTKRK